MSSAVEKLLQKAGLANDLITHIIQPMMKISEDQVKWNYERMLLELETKAPDIRQCMQSRSFKLKWVSMYDGGLWNHLMQKQCKCDIAVGCSCFWVGKQQRKKLSYLRAYNWKNEALHMSFFDKRGNRHRNDFFLLLSREHLTVESFGEKYDRILLSRIKRYLKIEQSQPKSAFGSRIIVIIEGGYIEYN